MQGETADLVVKFICQGITPESVICVSEVNVENMQTKLLSPFQTEKKEISAKISKEPPPHYSENNLFRLLANCFLLFL